MALHTPNPEDQRKLHAEINQIINQRFLLTTLAVTVFGIIAAWLLPKERPQPGASVGLFTYAGSILLMTLLFVLFFFLHRLRAMSKTLAAYLILTKQSIWEEEWKKYRKDPYFGYTELQAVVFLILGVLAVAIPFFLCLGFSLKLDPIGGAAATGAVGIIYMVLVAGMAFRNWFYKKEAAWERWKQQLGVAADD